MAVEDRKQHGGQKGPSEVCLGILMPIQDLCWTAGRSVIDSHPTQKADFCNIFSHLSADMKELIF